MQKKNGFTLLEVLVVVVIAVSVAAFAVPAYKKTQEKNKYLAAQGVLLDLGTAVRAVRAELDSGTFPADGHFRKVENSWQTEDSENESESKKPLTSSNADKKMFTRKYMAKIPFDNKIQSTYKGYSFFVCGKSSTQECCRLGDSEGVKTAVACMSSEAMRPEQSATKGQYWGAAFGEDGSIRRLSLTSVK